MTSAPYTPILLYKPTKISNYQEIYKMRRISGVVLVLGSVCFFIGVAQPVIIEFFGVTASLQLQLIEANPGQWQLGNLLMGIGSILAAAGVILFTLALRKVDSASPFTAMSYVASALVSVASAAWMFICYNRFALPPAEVAGNQNINSWAWPAFSVLITIGILLTGFIIMRVVSKIGGMLVMVIEFGLISVALIVFRDPIPAMHFLTILIMGITLIAARSSQVPVMSKQPV
jgi:hypothetical protein